MKAIKLLNMAFQFLDKLGNSSRFMLWMVIDTRRVIHTNEDMYIPVLHTEVAHYMIEYQGFLFAWDYNDFFPW